MRDLGKDIGVTQRTPYPGYEEALKKLKEAETTSTKGGIVKALRLDREHMPYIWRALQGLHYGIAPTLIGGYSLYNLLNSGTPQVDYQKFGGIIKTANARKWKHKDGGLIKVQEGTKMNWGQFATDGISALASAYLQNKQASSNGDIAKSGIDMNLSQKKLQLNQQAEQQTDQILNNMNYLFNTGQSIDNSAKSDIFRRFLKNKIASQGLAALDQEANNQKSMIDAQISQAKSESFGNAFSGILQQGLGMVGNYLASKNQATSQV